MSCYCRLFVFFPFQAENKIDDSAIDAIMEDVGDMMDTLAEFLKKLRPDMTPVHELMEDLKTFLEESGTYIHKELRQEAAALKDNEKKLKALQERIEFLEHSHTEL